MKRLFSAALALLLVSLFPLSAAAAPKAIADKVYRPALRIEKKAEGNVISLAWEAEGQIVSTKVTRVITNSASGGKTTDVVCNGDATQLTDTLELDNGMWEVAYQIAARVRVKNNKTKKITTSARFYYSNPESFQISAPELNMNIGKQIPLSCSLYPEMELVEKVTYTSDNPAVASVTKDGMVTAVAGGTAVITAQYGNGIFSDACTVNVAQEARAENTVYAENVHGPMTMIEGRDNRIWGTVVSETGINYIQIKIYNDQNKLELSHKVSITGKTDTYDMWRIRSNVRFRNLSKGAKTFAVYVSNEKATACVYKSAFHVVDKEEYAAKNSMLIRWAMTRLGDPYSQSSRGIGNYTDCSYFTQWCYAQIGITIPTSSSTQAKWAIRNDKLVSLDSLENGDLLFYTYSGAVSTNTYHVGIYYNGGVLEAGRRGVCFNSMAWNGTPAFAARVLEQK